MRWSLLVVLAFASCRSPESSACADGTICPAGTVCSTESGQCIADGQLDACAGANDGKPCDVSGAPGECIDGACAIFRCGDGTVTRDEECESGVAINLSCEDVGFNPGSLTCGATCAYDTSECGGQCGDGTVDPAEECEPSLPRRSCTTEPGVSGGEIRCDADCQVDRRECLSFGWEESASGADRPLTAITATGARIVAAGQAGALVESDGRAWEALEGPGSYDYTAALALEDGQLWLGTSVGGVYHDQDGRWVGETVGAGEPVVGLAYHDDTLFAVTDLSVYVRKNGSWTETSRGGTDLVATASGQVYLSAPDGIWRWDDEGWSLVVEGSFDQMAASKSGLVVAAGQRTIGAADVTVAWLSAGTTTWKSRSLIARPGARDSESPMELGVAAWDDRALVSGDLGHFAFDGSRWLALALYDPTVDLIASDSAVWRVASSANVFRYGGALANSLALGPVFGYSPITDINTAPGVPPVAARLIGGLSVLQEGEWRALQGSPAQASAVWRASSSDNLTLFADGVVQEYRVDGLRLDLVHEAPGPQRPRRVLGSSVDELVVVSDRAISRRTDDWEPLYTLKGASRFLDACLRGAVELVAATSDSGTVVVDGDEIRQIAALDDPIHKLFCGADVFGVSESGTVVARLEAGAWTGVPGPPRSGQQRFVDIATRDGRLLLLTNDATIWRQTGDSWHEFRLPIASADFFRVDGSRIFVVRLEDEILEVIGI